MTKETFFLLTGRQQNGIWLARLSSRQEGNEISVKFDGRQVLSREEKYGDIVGFYHSHPPGFLAPSKRDHDTMNAWSFCFGKALLCVIAADGQLRAWIYDCSSGASVCKQADQVEIFKGRTLVAISRADCLSPDP
jgi:hypothetical protein